MTPWFLALGIGFLGYLFGSLPFGYLAGRIAGTDIRAAGSGNIGATNVLRVLGKKWGYAVFLADAFKGFAVVRLASLIVDQFLVVRPHAEYFAILAAVVYHRTHVSCLASIQRRQGRCNFRGRGFWANADRRDHDLHDLDNCV